MKSFAAMGIGWLVGLLLMPASTLAAIVVIPASPLSTQSVLIRLSNQYASEATVASETIVRVGNHFTINQTVNVICSLPSAPLLTSDFSVGVLEPGAYSVEAQIVNVGFGPACNPPPLAQNISFNVADPVAVPVGHVEMYLAIALMIFVLGARQIERRHEA